LIIGQDESITQIVDLYQTYLTGPTAQGCPIGSFLFLGPTGSGKTRTVEATAEVSTANPLAVIKIDCAEFQHSHEIAKLIYYVPITALAVAEPTALFHLCYRRLGHHCELRFQYLVSVVNRTAIELYGLARVRVDGGSKHFFPPSESPGKKRTAFWLPE
jgi:hypothetical protein